MPQKVDEQSKPKEKESKLAVRNWKFGQKNTSTRPQINYITNVASRPVSPTPQKLQDMPPNQENSELFKDLEVIQIHQAGETLAIKSDALIKTAKASKTNLILH